MNELKNLQVIDYKPQKEKPQIYFLHNRVIATDLFINEKNILKRKNAYNKRLNAMINFCNNQYRCKSELIGNYFNDDSIKSCGICDTCLTNKRITITNQEFNFISGEIKKICSTTWVSKQNLLALLPTVKKNKVWKVLRFLLEENSLIVDAEGLIKSK